MCVLVLDADPLGGLTLVKLLQDRGFDAYWTEHPAQALEVLDSRACLAVLADLRLEGMDGFEFLDLVKTRRFQVEVVLCNAHWPKNLRERANLLGAAATLSRPFEIDRLVRILCTLRSRAQKANT